MPFPKRFVVNERVLISNVSNSGHVNVTNNVSRRVDLRVCTRSGTNNSSRVVNNARNSSECGNNSNDEVINNFVNHDCNDLNNNRGVRTGERVVNSCVVNRKRGKDRRARSDR